MASNAVSRYSAQPDKHLIYWLWSLNSIPGWLAPTSAFVSSALAQYQAREGFRGNIAEIGVYHGKYLTGLATTLQDGETAIAIDVFDDQTKNADVRGYDDVGSTGIHTLTERALHENATRFCPRAQLSVIKSSSLDVRPADILNRGDKIRFFSIDGGHTRDVLLNDLKLAEETLAPHGIISIDDIMNLEWPGVVTGAVRFLDQSKNLRPVAFIPNKLLCAFEPYVDLYREAIEAILPHGLKRKNVEFSSYNADLYVDSDDVSVFLDPTTK